MKLTSTADIYEMMTAYVGSAALNTALELGLFWVLVQRPDTAWKPGSERDRKLSKFNTPLTPR